MQFKLKLNEKGDPSTIIDNWGDPILDLDQNSNINRLTANLAVEALNRRTRILGECGCSKLSPVLD